MPERIETVLSLLQKHKKEYVQGFLKERVLRFSGTWETVADRLRASVAKREITIEELIELLDTVEESGRQHIFLYQAAQEFVDELADESRLRRRLRRIDQEHLLNEPTRIVELPAQTRLVKVRKTDSFLRIKWIERRTWLEPVKTEESGTRVIKEYERMTGRAVILFHLEFRSRLCQFRMTTLEHGSNYRRKLADYQPQTQQLVQWDVLRSIGLVRAGLGILQSGEARERHGILDVADGVTAHMISPSESTGFKDSKFYQGGFEAADGRVSYRYLNVYWLPRNDSPLTREVRTVIYINRNEVTFPAECREEEVTYVLSRILHFASARA
jgi:hypothetical protein